MQKVKVSLFNLLLLIVVLILFSGCQKSADNNNPPGNEESVCRIVKIKQELGFIDGQRTGLVYYNSHGDPDSVIFDITTGSAGPQFFYFVYDGNHQLVEYREDYSREPGDYYFKNNYHYLNGLVDVDTTRIRQAGSGTVIYQLKYDTAGRVVEEDGLFVEADGQPVSEELEPIYYYYDAKGNLSGDEFPFDDKTSFLRTNNVWMFTQRNYSVNNPTGATSYNSKGLPSGFQPNSDGDIFLGFHMPVELTYECN